MKRSLKLVSASVLVLTSASQALAVEADNPVLESQAWITREKESAAASFATTENLRGIYQDLVKSLSASPSASSAVKALLTKDPSRLSNAQLKSGLKSLASAVRTQSLIPAGGSISPGGIGKNLSMPNSDCASEIGYESGLDMQYTYRNAWTTGSLVGNVNFPLRQHLTCIRNQGSRGACTVFASAAALEVLVHQDTDRFVNFSEQHLYLWAYANVDPDDSEGIPTEKAVEKLISESYGAVLESGWQYNPSKYRTDKTDEGMDGTFSDVCVGYTESNASVSSKGGEYCSETIHQGEEVTIRKSVSSGGMEYTITYKDYNAPSSARPTTYGFGSRRQLWDESSPDDSLELAKTYLRNGVPIISGGGVTPSFKRNGAHGFVPYVRNEEISGGHAMLIVGWVSNSELPTGAPSGSGGGYFIFRNSWGMNSTDSDRGYYYAPYNYVKEHTAGLSSVTLR